MRMVWRKLPLVLLLALSVAPVALRAQDPPTVVYLVRHAEKMDDGADPALTEEGQARASLLAAMLADAGVTRILSSDFDRTRSTAAPLAARLDLEVEIYDPRDLAGLAEQIRSEPGRFLISGHSNTTPALVELLGGEPGEPIREADEYDRLYVMVLEEDGPSTVLLRYGPPMGR